MTNTMSQDQKNSNLNPLCVYIAARGHSGSTMFELLLNRYPALAAAGEIDQFPLQLVRDGVKTRWEGLCSCGRRPPDCEVWQAVRHQAQAELDIDIFASPFSFPVSDVGLAQEYGMRRPLARLGLLAHRAIRSLYHRLSRPLPGFLPYRNWVRNRDIAVRAIAAHRGVSAVVDASKDAMQMSDLVAFSELPVKVLYLTRDVRGNAWSAVRRKSGTAADEARSWVAVHERIHSRLSAIPDAVWMQVKYEDLCFDTDKTLAGVLEFLGIDCEPISPAEELARRHTIAGNQVRFKELETIRHDAAWRDNLSTRELDEIRAVAGPMASKLNYEI